MDYELVFTALEVPLTSFQLLLCLWCLIITYGLPVYPHPEIQPLASAATSLETQQSVTTLE